MNKIITDPTNPLYASLNSLSEEIRNNRNSNTKMQEFIVSIINDNKDTINFLRVIIEEIKKVLADREKLRKDITNANAALDQLKTSGNSGDTGNLIKKLNSDIAKYELYFQQANASLVALKAQFEENGNKILSGLPNEVKELTDVNAQLKSMKEELVRLFSSGGGGGGGGGSSVSLKDSNVSKFLATSSGSSLTPSSLSSVRGSGGIGGGKGIGRGGGGSISGSISGSEGIGGGGGGSISGNRGISGMSSPTRMASFAPSKQPNNYPVSFIVNNFKSDDNKYSFTGKGEIVSYNKVKNSYRVDFFNNDDTDERNVSVSELNQLIAKDTSNNLKRFFLSHSGGKKNNKKKGGFVVPKTKKRKNKRDSKTTPNIFSNTNRNSRNSRKSTTKSTTKSSRK
jgi:hypothetical protein